MTLTTGKKGATAMDEDSWMDADALASAGHGTDEDYGFFGEWEE
jgi:hypothetical protein